jgi:hypothetical protein
MEVILSFSLLNIIEEGKPFDISGQFNQIKSARVFAKTDHDWFEPLVNGKRIA